ncbi:MAG: YD repeat protein, partial [Candidatus Uhrbacteria bacterium GW2011_GWC2_53_7]
MNERHSYLAQSKKRTILAFAFLFVFSPIFPALARESASRDMVPSSKPSIEREMKTEPVKKSEPPASLKNAETARDTETKSDPKPDPDPPKFGTDPDTKSDDGHDGEPSKEDPAVARLTAVNPAALSTNLTPSTIKQLLPTADASTGALTYSYPFTLPPGRAGMAPDLRLSYNNQSSQDVSFVGHGWSLSVPFIERLNKMGTNGIYTSDYFSSSIGGELSPIGSGLYAPKVEDGSFVEYELFGNVWTLRDKEGTIYTYGATVDERQDNPADASQVFTWMLSEIRDRNDNFVSFAYDKDAGAIYPSSIVYTGHGSVDGIFEVVFVREARPDPSTSYRTAFGVTTNDRLSLIDVYADGDLVRSYDLGYASGDNGTRSVLTSITETGYDDTSAPVSLLPVEIEYQTTAPGWSTNATWEAPVGFAPQNSACNNLGSRVADVNGDGLPDVLQSRMDSAGNTWQSVYINNGSGWTLDPSWVIPRAFGYTSWCSGDFGSEVVDVNGDALADIIHYRIFSNSSAFEHEVYLNTGSGWVQNFTWTIPRAFRLEWSDWGTRLADVNGDGLTDFVWSKGNDRGVALNTGSNWVVDPSWSVPIIFTFDSLFVRGTEVADVNGDGLADIIEANTGSSGFQQAVYLNTGSGWTLDLSWIFPAPLRINNFADYGTRLADMNGDGLLDVLVGYATSNNFFEAYMNTGSGWVSAPSWLPLPSVFAAGGFGSDTGVRLVDVDGNGMMDFVKSLDTGSSLFPLITDTWLANGLRADRATTFVSPSGGTTSVEYQTPQEMTDGPILLNPETPFVFDVVSEIERDNGFGTVSTHDYLYEGGVYDFSTLLDRKFAGFHIRTETDAEGNQVRDYFHQGNATDAALGELSDHVSKAGRAYRTEVLNVAGDLVQAAVNGWDRADLGDGRSFVKLTQSLALGYDGNATHRDRATAYVYNNANGNVTQMVEWGEVSGNSNGTFSDVGSDKRTTTVSYASNPTYHILGLPSQVTVTDFSGALVSDAKAYYDGLPLESVNIGNETLEERWVDGSEYVSTQKAYNAYGFVIAQWDELGRM